MKNLLALISVSFLISACGGESYSPYQVETDPNYDPVVYIHDQGAAVCDTTDEWGEVILTPIEYSNDFFVTCCGQEGDSEYQQFCEISTFGWF